MSIISSARPELKPVTLKAYEKEYEVIKDEYDIDDDIELFNMIVEIAVEEMNLDHLFFNTNKYQKGIRLSILRTLTNLFKDEINDEVNEILDLIILEERFKF